MQRANTRIIQSGGNTMRFYYLAVLCLHHQTATAMKNTFGAELSCRCSLAAVNSFAGSFNSDQTNLRSSRK